jgi:hypothetical protein
MKIPSFANSEDRRKWFKENKSLLMIEKKSTFKEGDISTYSPSQQSTKAVNKNDNTLQVKAVINTIGVLDSHGDVHMTGIWNKTVNENKSPYLLQEHKMAFDSIISEKVKPSVDVISWKELGVNAIGSTEALVFNAEIDKDRNTFMFNQYKNGWVRNHSVGMQYVKISLAVNDSEMKEEFEEWQSTIDKVINKEEAERLGYYFTVYEAKMIEGSAVPVGSNSITPTLETKDTEPPVGTHTTKPPVGTSRRTNTFFN